MGSRGRIMDRSGRPGTGVAGGGTLVDVANEAALGAVNNSAMSEGEYAWVRSYLDGWTLRNSGAALVANQVIAAASGGNWRWHRNNTPNAFWQSQSTWYVDAATGNDENSGLDVGAPLLTQAERSRRIGGPTLGQVNAMIAGMTHR